MEPDGDDVREMAAALMAVISSTQRASRTGDAATLAALQIVAMRGPVRPSDIAAELGVHQSTVTRQVQALAHDGLVHVTIDPGDRRSCTVALSEKGLEEAQRLMDYGLARFAKFVEGWDASEVRTLARLLRKLEESKARVKAEEARPAAPSWRDPGASGTEADQ